MSIASLLPARTIAYLHVRDWQALVRRAERTAGGKLLSDPEITAFISPALDALLDTVFPASALDAPAGGAAPNLSKLLRRLPHLNLGAVTYARVRHDDGTAEDVWLMQSPRGARDAADLLSAWQAAMTPGEVHLREENHHGVRLQIAISDSDADGRHVIMIEHERVHAATYSLRTAIVLADVLAQRDRAPLASSDLYRHETARSTSAEIPTSPPLLECYADLVAVCGDQLGVDLEALVDKRARDKLSLGDLGPLRARVWLGEKGYDAVVAVSFPVGKRRAGLTQLLTPGKGSLAIERCWPRAATHYFTGHLDLERQLKSLAEIVDPQLGAGAALRLLAAEFGERDPEILAALVPHLEGRISWGSWAHHAHANRTQSLVVFALAGGRAETDVQAWLAKHYAALASAEKHAGRAYLKFASGRCVCAAGSALWLASDADALHDALACLAGEAPRLADEIDVKAALAKVNRLTTADSAAALHVVRWNVLLENLLRAVRVAALDAWARQGAFSASILAVALSNALAAHPLPDISLLLRHLAPWAGVLSDDGESLHYTLLGLSRASRPAVAAPPGS